MFFLVIGIVIAMAVGAVISRHSRHLKTDDETGEGIKITENTVREGQNVPPATFEPGDVVLFSHVPSPAPGKTEPAAAPAQPDFPQKDAGAPVTPEAGNDETTPAPEEVIVPLKPLLAAEPIRSPSAQATATYSSIAPPALSGDSPYSFVSDEPPAKVSPSLLRWCGRTGKIQAGDFIVRGPVTYWSEGTPSVDEPSCIDVSLPVIFPGEAERDGSEKTGDDAPVAAGAVSYREMTPEQRGEYLVWLAGGRIQPPAHISQAVLWLFGLERRVLSDRLDITVCVGEAFRLLPLIRKESLRRNLVKFLTWMAAKAWLPEDQLLAFSRSLPFVPPEILIMLLRPYADSKLPLPATIAFTVMRAAVFPDTPPLPASAMAAEDMAARFASVYRAKCQGGLLLPKAKEPLFVAYVPANPSLAGDKNAGGGLLELPNFFHDPENFSPLVAAWSEFLKTLSSDAAPEDAAEPEDTRDRPDWDAFVQERLVTPDFVPAADNAEGEQVLSGPVVTDLKALAELMRIEPRLAEDGAPRKPAAADRRKIEEAARIEGFLVVPLLGVSGKEYRWEDPLALMPLAGGERISGNYAAAELMLEFSFSLLRTLPDTAETVSADMPERLRDRLSEWFSLDADDRTRLAAVTGLLPSRKADPENVGECLRFWLSREELGVARDFLNALLAPDTPPAKQPALTRAVRAALEVAPDEPPPAPEAAIVNENPAPLAERLRDALAALFKN